jgi:NADH:ubiquinone oxidoreductase subunit 2 (subunit N)
MKTVLLVVSAFALSYCLADLARRREVAWLLRVLVALLLIGCLYLWYTRPLVFVYVAWSLTVASRNAPNPPRDTQH